MVTARRGCFVALVVGAALASLASLTGCDTIFGIGDLPFPSDGSAGDSGVGRDTSPPGDGGTDTRPTDSSSPKDAGDAEAEAGPVCTPTLAYSPVPWKPPSAFPQTACTTTQLTAYETCFPSCENFRQDQANAACVSCIETDENAVAHGPVITSNQGGNVVPVEVNIGGCQAQLDGNSSPGCCGNQENDSRGCLSTECGTCSDFADPAPGGPAQTCEQTATAGTCASFVPQSTCDAELDGGVAAQCLTLATFLPLWCTPPGPPPTCDSNTPFTAPEWEPPTAFGQPSCSNAQVTEYLACLGNCSTFDSDPTNATCVACIETDIGATSYGPVITSGGVPTAVNFGGCVANFDGNKAAGSCGDQINAFDACAAAECGTCADFANPTPGGPAEQCEENVFNAGVCSAFNAMTCDAELGDGGVGSACGNLDTFLPLWCAGMPPPADAGPPDSGAGGG
jgi:hypothetical protein